MPITGNTSMKLHPAIVIIGLILILAVVFLSLLPGEKIPVIKSSTDNDTSFLFDPCIQTPLPAYGMFNNDRNLSHRFDVSIADPSGITVGTDSFLLFPGEYLESGFRIVSKKDVPYDLAITVDGKATYLQRVNTSGFTIQSLDYYPDDNRIEPGILYHPGKTGMLSWLREPRVIPLVYPGEFRYYSFGVPTLGPRDAGVNTSEELDALLEKIVNDSEENLTPYLYPEGPVIGYGYDVDRTVTVQIYEEWNVNRSEINDIYSIIERHAQQEGIPSIPAKFLPMGLVHPDSG